MKRSGFKRKRKDKVSTKLTKGYKCPAWFMAIEYGAHGNTPAQKRLWKIVSNTYRKEDWEEDPHCRSCTMFLSSWKDGQLGHFKKWSLCNSWFKYERKNMALQCPACNFKEDGPAIFTLGCALIEKYGPAHLTWIETENRKYQGMKMHDWEIVDYASRVLARGKITP